MSKSRANLVAGRLSQPLAATGKSTYEKTRMGLALPGQTPPSPDAVTEGLPPVDTPPADAPETTRETANDATRDAAHATPQPAVPPSEAVAAPVVVEVPPAPPPVLPPEMPLAPPPEIPLVPPLEVPLAPPPAAFAPWEMPPDTLTLVHPPVPEPFAQDDRPLGDEGNAVVQADTDIPVPPPWEILASSAGSAVGAPTPQAMMNVASASLAEQVRAQAIQAWNAQQQSPEWELTAPAPPKPSAKVVHIMKIASPALGGLTLLLLVMYGLWTWVNGGFKPPQANADTPKPAMNTSANTASNSAATNAATAIVTIEPTELPVDPPDSDIKWVKVVGPDGSVIFVDPNETPTVDPVVDPLEDPVVETPVTPEIKPIVKIRPPPPNLRLISIVKRNKGPAAYINSRYLYVGERIAGATVVAIGRFTVDMEMDGEDGRERFTLSLTGDSEESESEPPPASESSPTPPVPSPADSTPPATTTSGA